MTGAVEEPLRAAAQEARFKTRPQKMFLNSVVDLFSVDTGADHSEGDLLALLDRRIHFSEPRGRFATNDRARKVGVIARRIVARENVHHDRLMRLERSGADLMRVDSLMTARNDRVFAGTTLL